MKTHRLSVLSISVLCPRSSRSLKTEDLWDQHNFYAMFQEDRGAHGALLPWPCIITGSVTFITANIKWDTGSALFYCSDSMAMGDDSHFCVITPYPFLSGIWKPGAISRTPNRNNMGALHGKDGLCTTTFLPPLGLKILHENIPPLWSWTSAAMGFSL